MTKQYDNNSIKSLKGADKVRLRPAVIFGDDTAKGCGNSWREVIDNSTDEALNGFGKVITAIRHADNSLTVIDEGRGIPLDWNKKEQEWNWKLIFMYDYAGGKYTDLEEMTEEELKKVEVFYSGYNGLGLFGTQSASAWMKVESKRDGYIYKINFKKGYNEGELIKEKYNGNDTGTKITWLPDTEVFTDINISSDFMKEIMKRKAFINKGIKYILIDEKENETTEYYYEKGIYDYVKENGKDKNFTDVQYLEGSGIGRENKDKKLYKAKFEIAYCFNNENNQIECYHNSLFLDRGGSTFDAIKNAFTYSIDKYIQQSNMYQKNEKKITFDDIKDSLIAVVNTFSTFTSYENQTKKAISNKFIKELITEKLKEQLEIFFTENKFEADKIANQILINKRARESSEKARLDVKKKLQSVMSSGLQAKNEDLNDCDMRNTTLDERWLFLCEGESACSTITSSRDSRTMGTYALRGRFISALKNSVEDVLNNKPALGIIQALGCGIEIPKNELKKYKNVDTFDISKLRYGNIVLACDYDGFGHGIALSLLTFFYKFMPTLLKQNRIYLSVSPRYKITLKNETLFVYNEQEKDALLKKLDSEGKKYDVNIVKGLGELNADVYWEYMLNPENRIMKQFIYDETKEDEIEYYFNTLMGENIEERKKYVKNNITNINLEEID